MANHLFNFQGFVKTKKQKIYWKVTCISSEKSNFDKIVF